MKIVICHQAITDSSLADERDVLDQVAAVTSGLVNLGHSVNALPCTLDLATLESQLQQSRPDLVFNLVESLNDRGNLISLVPSLLDTLGIPYTGASAEAMFLSSNKQLAKRHLEASGLPTPPGYPSAGISRFIVKSVWEHASRGLDAESVVGPSEVTHACKERARRFGGHFFAEAYLDGREFNVGVLDSLDGPRVLPIAEIAFDSFAPHELKIVDYAAKWDVESAAYQRTQRRAPAEAQDSPLLRELERLSLACWSAFELCGYARVDFRVTEAGKPYILEVNANPCLSPDAGFAAALTRAGIGFDDALARIVTAALAEAR
ncbi:MAG TPA: hypothetical protein VHM70_07225 [Polyangiaceae bacterium]|jgi:D-alanine-D-alanine ligase|nr:hypothetical protein [Polyangiaceae bacterium]